MDSIALTLVALLLWPAAAFSLAVMISVGITWLSDVRSLDPRMP